MSHGRRRPHGRPAWPLLLAMALLMAVWPLGPTSALADGGGGGGGGGSDVMTPSRPEDPDYTAAVRAIEAGDYRKAVGLLETVVARNGQSADAYNWLAYATRKTGEVTKAIPLYQRALALDPKHRGAHEYIGEAYLMLGDLPRAKEHLARLDALCFFPCAQYRDLKKAVQAYEASGGKVRPAAGSTN